MKLTPFLLLLLMSHILMGQSRETNLEILSVENKTNLFIKLGGGIPTSDFGDNDLDNPTSGIANPGLLFELGLNYSITESIYLSFMGRFQYNRLNEQEFINAYRSIVPSSVSISFESTAWKTNSFMAGFGTKTFLDDKTDFITRFMIGISSCKSASFDASLTDQVVTLSQSQTSGSGGSMSYLVGAGIKIEAKKGRYVIIAADYFGATPEFASVQFTQRENGATTINQQVSFEQEIRLINLSLGLTIPL